MTDIELKRNESAVGADKGVKAPVRNARVPGTDLIYTPPVDILEDHDSILLLAEMPGVDQQSVEVTVENNVLTIEGQAHVAIPDGHELVGQEYGVGRYRRDFTLSDVIQTDGIRAKVQHGLLEVTLPKKAEVRSRKIAIEA